jgi:hypothetical protein
LPRIASQIKKLIHVSARMGFVIIAALIAKLGALAPGRRQRFRISPTHLSSKKRHEQIEY